MVTSKLEDGVVWIVIEGDLKFEETKREISKWLPKLDTFDGFISDIRGMTNQSAVEQKKLEEWRKENKSSKPNAILAMDSAMAVLAKIYIRFTGAKKARYFTDPDEAVAWVKSYKA